MSLKILKLSLSLKISLYDKESFNYYLTVVYPLFL